MTLILYVFLSKKESRDVVIFSVLKNYIDYPDFWC